MTDWTGEVTRGEVGGTNQWMVMFMGKGNNGNTGGVRGRSSHELSFGHVDTATLRMPLCASGISDLW